MSAGTGWKAGLASLAMLAVATAGSVGLVAAHDIDLNQQIKQRFGAAIKKLLLDETDPDLIRSALILMREKGKASRAAMLHEFVIDVQNQRSIKPAHAAAGKGRVSTKASIKKWKKHQ